MKTLMRGQAILLAVPSLAMAVVGFAMFGPGAVRPFEGAQVWGGPTEGARRLSWRIAVVLRFRGIDGTEDVGGVVVRVEADNGASGVARCRTRPDGTCEVELVLTKEAAGNLHTTVQREGETQVLAEGDLTRARAWNADPGHPPHIRGRTTGDLGIDVLARRGILAAPFRDELVIQIHRGEAPAGAAEVTLHTEGADLDGAPAGQEIATRVTDARGVAIVGVAPRSHTVEADVRATWQGLSATWDGILPVVPGAIWLDPAALHARKIRVIAPVPREVAYAQLATARARLWSGIVPLETDAQGFAVGEIDWPEALAGASEPVWLTLASDPRATGAGTVGWPIPLPGGETTTAQAEHPFRDWLLLDGLPAAERRDGERRQRARVLSAVALSGAAVLEGFLLAEGARTAGQGARAWVRLVVAIATVVLAFAAVGIVAMWKTGG